jgi:hypothetical protein
MSSAGRARRRLRIRSHIKSPLSSFGLLNDKVTKVENAYYTVQDFKSGWDPIIGLSHSHRHMVSKHRARERRFAVEVKDSR